MIAKLTFHFSFINLNDRPSAHKDNSVEQIPSDSSAAPPLFQVIYEDSELLIINKPAGLVCHPTKKDAYSSLIGRLRLYLGEQSHPQFVNRLDRETSGLTVVAKSVAAARELRQVWEARAVRKEYQAIVHGHVTEQHRLLDLPLGKDATSEVAIKDCVRPDGAPAQTEFWTVGRFIQGGRPFTLLRVLPHTGRKHQIRIHLAAAGHPIVGDKLYGGDEDLYLSFVQWRITPEQEQRLIFQNQALHAALLEFEWRGRQHRYHAPPEHWFLDFLKSSDNPKLLQSALNLQ